MLTWVWVAGIAIALGALFFLLRQWRSPLPTQAASPQITPLERTVFSLEIGDIVQYLDTDWFVEGKLVYNSNGYLWVEYLLQDGDRIRWLSVEEDDRVEVALLEAVSGLDIPDTPPRELTYNGITYQRDESGTAQMTRVGATLNRQGETCQYYDYRGSGNWVLSIEDWGSDREVTCGQCLHPSAFTLLPGDGQRVYGA